MDNPVEDYVAFELIEESFCVQTDVKYPSGQIRDFCSSMLSTVACILVNSSGSDLGILYYITPIAILRLNISQQ